MRTNRSIADVRHALEDTEIVAFDADMAVESDKIRATLADRGDLINPLDMLIAGVARHADATVVAIDRHYGRVLNLDVRDPKAETDDGTP